MYFQLETETVKPILIATPKNLDFGQYIISSKQEIIKKITLTNISIYTIIN